MVGLPDILDLERIEQNIFRGRAFPGGRNRVFGGFVLGQALLAASRTVAGRPPHSLHAYFILPGDPDRPIVYQVERTRDGGSFSTRRCTAVQGGRTMFDMSVSFHENERGLEHQATMPDVPDPDTIEDVRSVAEGVAGYLPPGLQRWFDNEHAIDVRPCDIRRYTDLATPRPHQRIWFRAAHPLPADDEAFHRAALAYASDLTLIDVALAAHGRSLFEPEFAVASIDHALWFHRPVRADDWLLYDQDSPTTAGGRGLARGLIFDRSGRLVASVAQEGLIRQTDRTGRSMR